MKLVSGSRKLVPHRRTLPVHSCDLRGVIRDFLVDIGAPRAWGDHYELVRMAIYELALNAVEHGGAAEVELESRLGMVTMRAAGSPFGIYELRRGGGGGSLAAADLERDALGTLSLMYRMRGDYNEWCIVDQIVSEGANTPCGIVVPASDRNTMSDYALSEVRRLIECQEVHVYPGELWSYSDWLVLLRRVRVELGSRTLVVHGVRHNPQMARLITTEIPDARLPD